MAEVDDYSPCIITEASMDTRCAQLHIHKKESGVREFISSCLLDVLNRAVRVAVSDADAKGSRSLGQAQLDAIDRQIGEYPKALY